MGVKITDNVEARRFELAVDGELAALITYGRNNRMLALTHTETEDGFGGQGYATQLIEHAIGVAQRDGLELLPFCPFVRAYLRKNPEFLSLVPTQRRDDFELPGAPR